MGIEKFFSSIQENNITNLQTSFTMKLEKRLDAEYLYVDFNSIVYIVSHRIVADLNYLLFRIITNDLTDKNAKRVVKEYSLEKHLSLALYRKWVDDNINRVIVQKVLEYVINMVTNYIEPTKLKQLYVAIDGVPLKAKMIEQRKRRYMGMFIEKIKERIFQKHEKDLAKDPERYQYETNKIRWSTINITPGTEFMDKLVSALTEKSFRQLLKTKCPNLTEYIFSGPYEPGEGEKKIVDHLRGQKHDQPSEYVIYSPDSDVTLLCLLLNTNMHDNPKISKLKILRHNQQKGNYDVIDVDKLADNLFSYITKNVAPKGVPDKDSVINDTVFVLTVFGNDFVPKIQAFDVQRDFDRIIDKYIDVLKTNTKNGEFKYLINYNRNTGLKEINLAMFKAVIKILKEDEGGNLQKVYISTHYRNYDKLKKVIGATQWDFTEKLTEFLAKLREFNEDVKNATKETFKEVRNKWLSSDSNFIAIMMRITRLQLSQNTTPEQFITTYVEHYNRTHEMPRVAIYFRRFAQTLKSDFYKQKLERSLDYLGKPLKLTKYDEEIFKFDNMLDEYQVKLDAYKLNLGYVNIDPRTNTWKTAKIVDSVKKFYKEYFDIDDINTRSPKMKNLIEEYLMGLIWVFNYYFNHFSEDENRMFGDSWFYPYNYAPLITQIYQYMSNIDELKPKVNLDRFKVRRQDYFNCLEHLMYVSPAPSILYVIPKEYWEFAKTSPFYPDLDAIVDKVWKSPKATHEVDCRGVLFLNKCHIKQLHIDRDFSKDRKFIEELRAIKIPPEVERRKGTYKLDNSGNINVFNFSLKVQQAGMYHKYKRKYMQTGQYKYKRLYKLNKYRLMNLIK